MKPRVVILSAFLAPFRSGAEACAEEVARLLVSRYSMTIVTARLRRSLPLQDTLPGGAAVVRVGFGCPLDKWLFPCLAPFAARRLRPAIIHAVLESYAGLAMVFCRFLAPKAKRILTCQSTNTSLLLRLMHRSADRVTAISGVLVERARRFGKAAALIPNGIPFAGITESRLRGAKVPGRILFVGRLERMKGVDTLLTGFAEVPSSKFQVPSVHLRIVGDGSERQRLEGMARDLGIADRVTFTGYVPVPQIYDEFAQAEIFCGLSRSEALGNVFLEAQAAGCAVVATKVGGIPEIVEEGRTGLLVLPEDPDAAAEALRTLLGNAALRKQLGENGQKKAEQYDWSRIAERYATLYGELA